MMMLCCQIFENIAAQTAELVKKPYNPGLWASRADLLLRVGYPEVRNSHLLLALPLKFQLTSCPSQLAAGDARKAQKLFTAMREGKGVGLIARKQLLDIPGAPRLPSHLQDQKFWDMIAREFHYKNFMTLASALDQAGAFHSFREMCIGTVLKVSHG